tara:strand:+ start:380 stop:1153 length:774 start_codon:yes stop_codon:yes gene_type:complete
MIINFKINEKEVQADLNNPIDISLVSKSKKSFKAWYSEEITFKTIKKDGFIGNVEDGGPVNFKEIVINPHANMTHTESVGHISTEKVFINHLINPNHIIAQLLSVSPVLIQKENGVHKKGDKCVVLSQIENQIEPNVNALIIRTQKNYSGLAEREFSNTNWPYLSEQAALYIRNKGVKHLLIDQPSVDREVDGGKLLAHKAFWNYPSTLDRERTISELIGVPEEVEDGIYLLNLLVANIENDASPSRPTLYKVYFVK